MKAARFDYVRPADVGEALATVASAQGAKILAGGQSPGPMSNLRLARPALLVDISRLKALQQLEDTGRTWRIGAGVTHARLEDARGRFSGGEMLCEVAAAIAYRSVRNRGTIGGSLAHADPAADWPLALAALGASVNVRGPTPRKILVAHFIQGAFTTTLAADEIIESIDVPKVARGTVWLLQILSQDGRICRSERGHRVRSGIRRGKHLSRCAARNTAAARVLGAAGGKAGEDCCLNRGREPGARAVG